MITKAVQRTHHRETQEEELEDDITPIDKESSLDETAGSTLAVPEKSYTVDLKNMSTKRRDPPSAKPFIINNTKDDMSNIKGKKTPHLPIKSSKTKDRSENATLSVIGENSGASTEILPDKHSNTEKRVNPNAEMWTTIDENLDDTLDLNDKERSTLSPTDAAEKDSPAGGENTRTALLELLESRAKSTKTDKKDMPHESSPIIDTTDSEEPPLVTEIENSPPENQNESMTPLSQNVPGNAAEQITKIPGRGIYLVTTHLKVKDTPVVNPTETEMPGETSPPRELVQYITETSCRQLNRDLDEISRLKTVRNIREKSPKRADVADDVIDSTLLIQNVLRLDNKSMRLLHRMTIKTGPQEKKANKVHVVSNEIVSRKITAVRDKPESVDSPAPGESNPKAKSVVDALGVESHVVDESNTAIERDSVALGVNSPTLNQKDIETKSAVDATGVNSPAVVTGTINTSSSTAHNWCKFTSGRHKQHRRQQPYCGAPCEVTSPRKTGTKSKSVVDALGVESHVVDESNTAIERDSVALGVNSPTLNDRGIETKSAVDATGVNSPALSKTLTKVKSVVNATAVNSPAVVTGTINTSSSTAVLRVTSPAPSPTNITVRSKVSTTGVNSPAPSKTLTKIEGVVNATGVNSPAIGKRHHQHKQFYCVQILRDARIGTELQHTISRGTANVSKIATIIANHRDTIDFEHFNRSEAKKSHRFSTTSLRSVKIDYINTLIRSRYDEIRTKLENIPRIENVPNAIIEEFDAQEQFLEIERREVHQEVVQRTAPSKKRRNSLDIIVEQNNKVVTTTRMRKKLKTKSK
ncbi:hypothetical protein KQX54_013564 [Cotesia glomerata]|uniref:Uncharacterized protein n=1 Tax=Cotesia glomerata TaxID=32391 RepID=A0AAV7J1R1_COTGL|nr:hypothetical protein KQX54_013564 [Cotesia glomerata]